MPKQKNTAAAQKRVEAAKAKIMNLTNQGFKLNPKHASQFTVNAMGAYGTATSGRVGARGTVGRARDMAANDELFNPGPRKDNKGKGKGSK